jgi:hypothetical protein
MRLLYEDALKFIDGTLNFLAVLWTGLFRISPLKSCLLIVRKGFDLIILNLQIGSTSHVDNTFPIGQEKAFLEKHSKIVLVRI